MKSTPEVKNKEKKKRRNMQQKLAGEVNNMTHLDV
jgi:hypothetical protein